MNRVVYSKPKIRILDFRPFDSVGTMKLIQLQLLREDLSEYKTCASLEGFELTKQLDLLDRLDSSQIDYVMIPRYTKHKDKLEILEISKLPVVIMEIGTKCIEEVRELKAVGGVEILITSLPVRLGCILRDLGEGPEPDQEWLDLDDSNPEWTSRVVDQFMELVHDDNNIS